MKYFIEIWGCQMNEHDAETLAGIVEAEGYERHDSPEGADLIILYTCCIRDKAEKKVLGRIGALKKLLRNRKAGLLAVGGCMTQQEEVALMLRKKFKVDIVFGTHNINNFAELLAACVDSGSGVCEVLGTEEMEIREDIPIKRTDDLKAYVNIIYGCNNFCSYCIVPYVRGREKSRQVEEIRKEVEGLLKEGYRDITLLGQNVNSYGKDLENKDVNFINLLKELDGLGEYRLRFMSSHPRDFNKELVDVIYNSKNVCPQFHLPFQSGSDQIIKEMNRGYTKEHYLEITRYIQAKFQDAAISTDIIVGFPGETEADFLDTLDLVSEVGFDQAYMFIYSVREGTRAAKMEGHLSEEVKKERFDRLLALQSQKSLEKNQEMLGKVYEVLVEKRSPKGRLIGRTRGNKVVNFEGDDELLKSLVMVKMLSANTWSLTGEVVK